MNKKICVLGIITARGGSKGIPRKNIKNLHNKPLICYTIEAVNKSKLLTRCIVSTDDKEIAEISKNCGGDVPFMRPDKLAQDESTSIEVVQHVVSELKKQNEEYDYIMILQPTSPLRSSGDIDNCIKLVKESGADSVMSMVEITDFSLKKIKKIVNNKIEPFFEEEGATSARRQDQIPAYKRNASIYLTKTNLIMHGDLFGENSISYVMPEERSVDINKITDFALAEFWLKK